MRFPVAAAQPASDQTVSATPAFVLLAGAAALVLSAVVAGLVSLLVERRKDRREKHDWFREKKYAAYADLLENVGKVDVFAYTEWRGQEHSTAERQKIEDVVISINRDADRCLLLISTQEGRAEFSNAMNDFTAFTKRGNYNDAGMDGVTRRLRTLTYEDLRATRV